MAHYKAPDPLNGHPSRSFPGGGVLSVLGSCLYFHRGVVLMRVFKDGSTPVKDVTEYMLIRSQLMDGGIPITMPIGFQIASGTNNTIRVIDKDISIQEPLIAISRNVLDLVFFGLTSGIVNSKVGEGEVLYSGATWKGRESNSADRKAIVMSNPLVTCECPCKDRYILRAIREAGIRFFLYTDCVRRSMGDNAKILKNDAYLPLPSSHNLLNYVNVLPYNNDGVLRLTYRNGMNDDYLTRIYSNVP